MKKGVTYKHSGIPWLGDVPAHWEVVKVKQIAKLKTGHTPPSTKRKYFDGCINWYTPADIANNVLTGSARTLTKTAVDDSEVLLVSENSTFLVAIGSVGKVGFSEKPACSNQQITALTPNDGIDPKWLFYALMNEQTNLGNLAMFTILPILNNNYLGNYYLPFPPLAEQRAIAAFLDEKTAQLDGAIESVEKSVELLRELRTATISEAVTRGLNAHAPLRDSGIPWIGKVPVGWEVSRVKFVAKIFGRIGFRGYKAEDMVDEGQGAITLSPSNLSENGLSLNKKTYLSWEKYEESPEIKVFQNDILFTKTGSSYGKSAFVNELNEPATINPQLLVFKNVAGANKFFYYLTCCSWFLDQVECAVVGGAIPTIAQEKISNFYIVWPPLEEQQEIARYLDEKTAQIDALVSAKQHQVQLLRELRVSVVAEAVTGKLGIRE